MGVQYFCKHKRRRQTVREHPTLTLNGIDYLEVLDRDAELLASPRQRTLLLRCIRPLSTTVTAENVEISGGVRITPVDVEWAARASDAGDLFGQGLISEDERDYFLGLEDPDHVLVVRTNSEGDYSTYLLCLVTDHAPITGFDPPLTIVEFSFKVECPSEFDCQAEDACPPEAKTPPPLDYLAKDYASFRRLMLDRLSVVMPDWKDGLPADLGVALVEVMAYAGDYLSYYQDAAATEAYLGTARRRPSIRRHTRRFRSPSLRRSTELARAKPIPASLNRGFSASVFGAPNSGQTLGAPFSPAPASSETGIWMVRIPVT